MVISPDRGFFLSFHVTCTLRQRNEYDTVHVYVNEHVYVIENGNVIENVFVNVYVNVFGNPKVNLYIRFS